MVSLEQLLALGFTASGVRTLVATGRLHRVHQGVYALSPAPLSRGGNWLAALLAGGAGSLLAARSAGANYGLIANSSAVIDVMSPRRVATGGNPRPPDAGTRAPGPGRPPRHPVHLGGADAARPRRGEPRDLGGALEQAEDLGLFDLNAIGDIIHRNEGRPGVGRLRSALAVLVKPGPKFRSEFERVFRLIVRSAGLPEPLVNHVLQLPDGPLEPDYWWPDHRLVVECDGYEFHRDRRGIPQRPAPRRAARGRRNPSAPLRLGGPGRPGRGPATAQADRPPGACYLTASPSRSAWAGSPEQGNMTSSSHPAASKPAR